MKLFQKKAFQVLAPQAIKNNASYTCNVVDTLQNGIEWLELEIIVSLGATDIALTALKLQQSDTEASSTSLTSGADVSGTVFGTDDNDTKAASTLPSATDDNKLFSFHVDLRGKKRYLLPTIAVGNGATGAFVSAIGLLSRGNHRPRTASQAGFSQRMVA